MVKSPTGFPIQPPYLAIANRQAEIMMRYRLGVWIYSCQPQPDFRAASRSIAAF
jgi:hypothetical protein